MRAQPEKSNQAQGQGASAAVKSAVHAAPATRWQRLWALILTFGKFGGITFGGGYAIVALLEEELVEKKGWLTSAELLDIITVGESTPGAIAVNTATFVGYRLAGFWGGVVATAALVFPAWLVIVSLSTCYLVLRENRWVAAALAGIRIAAVVLIIRAFFRMSRGVKRTCINLAAMTVAFGLVTCTPLNAIWVVLGGLLFGVLCFGRRERQQQLPNERQVPKA